MPDPRFLNPITVLADIGGVSIDVTDRLNENYENLITENPVEDGSPTTDHITNLPVKITIEGGFSDLKISNLVGPAITQNAYKGRAKLEFDKLFQLWTRRSTFMVMDGWHLIKDMAFKRLQLIKDEEGFSLKFSAELWQIQKVQLRGGHPSYRLQDANDAYDRTKMTPQLLLSVGAISKTESLESIGVLA